MKVIAPRNGETIKDIGSKEAHKSHDALLGTQDYKEIEKTVVYTNEHRVHGYDDYDNEDD